MCECCGVVKDIYLPQAATVNKVRMMNGTELFDEIIAFEKTQNKLSG